MRRTRVHGRVGLHRVQVEHEERGSEQARQQQRDQDSRSHGNVQGSRL